MVVDAAGCRGQHVRIGAGSSGSSSGQQQQQGRRPRLTRRPQALGGAVRGGEGDEQKVRLVRGSALECPPPLRLVGVLLLLVTLLNGRRRLLRQRCSSRCSCSCRARARSPHRGACGSASGHPPWWLRCRCRCVEHWHVCGCWHSSSCGRRRCLCCGDVITCTAGRRWRCAGTCG